MKSVNRWLDEYSESHQHPVNKLIHFVCVPLLIFSLLGILWSVELFNRNNGLSNILNPAVVFLFPVLVYYFILNWKLAIGMVCITAMLLGIFISLDELKLPISIWKIYMIIFVVTWICQFAGHLIEGKKPSFLKDIQFLLIGPLWLLAFVYRKLNLNY